MKVDAPLIATSARKHGIHDDDMIHAFNYPILVEDLDDGFTMFIGPTRRATCSKSASWTVVKVRSSCTP